MSVVKKGPDVALASKVGDPTLVDPTPVAANQETIENHPRSHGDLPAGDNSVGVEVIKGRNSRRQ